MNECECGKYKEKDKEDCESCEREELAMKEEAIRDEAYERYQAKLIEDFYEGRM